MFCKNCGSQISDQAAFCKNCGASVYNVSDGSINAPPDVQQSANLGFNKGQLYWLPITLAVVSIFFSGMGGDADLNEINGFDYISALIGVVSFILVFYTIPSHRKKLKIISIIITAFVAFVAVFYLLP